MSGIHFKAQGFTLVELIMVLMLAGILAVFVLPKFNSTALPERGFHDAVWSTVAHARRMAVASRRFVCVTVTGGTGSSATVAVTRDASDPDSVVSVNCSVPLSLPAPDSSCAATNQVCAPRGVTLGGTASLVFDPLGRLVNSGSPKTVAASAAAITVSNQNDISVQPETGYVQ
jgi:MSHA pilin protein MshC